MLTGVLGAIIIGLAGNWLQKKYPFLMELGFQAVLFLSALWLLLRTLQVIQAYLTFRKSGKRAVLVYLLDSKDRVLLIRHPFHKVRLPVGGRLLVDENPHEAVARVLGEEAGVTNFEFDKKFHEPSKVVSEVVSQVPAPFAAHIERRKQRDNIFYHYAFVYVCRYEEQSKAPNSTAYQPAWFTFDEMASMAHGERPFEDIHRRYAHILLKLNPKRKIQYSGDL
jgi:8-oxo-dGTP pyrophosphatase MutT (NUDIX family)